MAKKIKLTTQLVPGDKVAFGREVVGIVRQGMNIPSGKTEVHLKHDKTGRITATFWSNSARIQIKD